MLIVFLCFVIYLSNIIYLGTPPTEPVNMAGTLRNVGRLVPNRSALFLCDLQEKFRPIVQYFPEIVAISGRMLHAAKALNMPVIITEQYPKGDASAVLYNCQGFDRTSNGFLSPKGCYWTLFLKQRIFKTLQGITMFGF